MNLPTRDELLRTNGYLWTTSGRAFYPARTDQIDIYMPDLIQSTSKLCRFGGHVRRFYSVAEHMLTTCRIAEIQHGRGSQEARCALIHDLSEGLLVDVPSPIKLLLPEYKAIERRIEEAIYAMVGAPPLSDPVWDSVKRCDEIALHKEACALFDQPPPWAEDVGTKFGFRLRMLGPKAAARAFTGKLWEYQIGIRETNLSTAATSMVS